MALMPDTVEAGPLLLRRWAESDLSALLEAIESSISDLQRWMDWAANGVPSVESERAALAAGAAEFDTDTGWGYSLIEASTGEVVGGCGLHPRSGHTLLEIGYWVRSDRRRRGYATTAVHHLVDACFDHVTDAERIEIRMDVANIASARVPETLGFVVLGEIERDRTAPGHTGRGLVWSVDRSHWRERDPERR